MEDHKKLIKEIFKNIFETPSFDEAIVRKYFSTDYIQHVDGKTLGFDHFIKHVEVVKDAMQSMSINFKTLVQENDTVFTNHIVTGTTKEGRTGDVQVIGEFRIRNGQVIYCDELTHQLSGDPKDRDLGSRV
ncbi:MAG: hypothetical protein JWR38_1597 [Mucilaginibacter sp.]|nr:hypothetical protein [Mucilaginibacter sp.]